MPVVRDAVQEHAVADAEVEGEHRRRGCGARKPGDGCPRLGQGGEPGDEELGVLGRAVLGERNAMSRQPLPGAEGGRQPGQRGDPPVSELTSWVVASRTAWSSSVMTLGVEVVRRAADQDHGRAEGVLGGRNSRSSPSGIISRAPTRRSIIALASSGSRAGSSSVDPMIR